MSDLDWQPVVLRPKKEKPTNKSQVEKQVNAARQTGSATVVTKPKTSAPNKQRSSDFDTRKLDKDEGDYSIHTVGLETGKKIVQARNAKGLTQKQLAMEIQETTTVIQAYESGKAVPNQKVIAKIEKALGTKVH